MRLVCGTEEWARKYLEICEHRELPFTPWMCRNPILVADGKELIAGVMVYDTAGPFVFFEHYVTNQTATLRQRYRASDLVAQEVVNVSRALGKLPQVIIKHKGIQRFLERYGLRVTGAYSMTCTLKDLEKHEQTDPTAPHHANRRQSSAPPGDPAEGNAPDHH